MTDYNRQYKEIENKDNHLTYQSLLKFFTMFGILLTHNAKLTQNHLKKGEKMVKTITLKWLQSKGACLESLEEWHKETDHGTLATLNRLIDKNPEWGNWLICRLMNKKQAVKYAVFAAEQVIDIYEKAYPNDKRPRNAIEAAKEYLKNPSKKTKDYAYAAYDAAYTAAYTTYAAYDAAYAAAYTAAYAAAYTAAYASASAAYAAYAAAAASASAAYAAADTDERRKMKTKILKYGIGLLEQS